MVLSVMWRDCLDEAFYLLGPGQGHQGSAG